MARTVRVLIAATRQSVRQGVSLLLGAQPDIHVVGEAGERRRALSLAAARKPQVLVVDLLLPGYEYLEFLQQVSTRSPQTRVVLLSMPPEPTNLARSSTAYSLVRAVRDSAARRSRVKVPMPAAVIDAHGPAGEGPKGDLFEKLTPREQEVALMATEGLSSRETARRLGISPRTVESHRTRAMRKLGLHRRAELVRYALARGLLAR
jgi:DNA-binding NarL/FixJ family response regulator